MYSNLQYQNMLTRLPPVVENFRYADTIGRSRVNAKCVRLNDTTPAQVISLSVVMPGCSPGPSEWHYSKLDMNSSSQNRGFGETERFERFLPLRHILFKS